MRDLVQRAFLLGETGSISNDMNMNKVNRLIK